MKPRIVLADDHEMIRTGLRVFLEAHSRWEVCGEASNGKEAVAKVLAERPDLVVLDLSMPEMSGLEAAREIRRLAPATKIVIFTMHDAPHVSSEVRRAGADAYVVKTAPARGLIDTIESLLTQRPRIS